MSVIKELFAANVYAALGRGAFYVPQHRLAVLPRMNQFTRNDIVALALDEQIRAAAPGSTHSLFILSQWMTEYQDLAELLGCLRDQAPPVAAAAWLSPPPSPWPLPSPWLLRLVQGSSHQSVSCSRWTSHVKSVANVQP